MKTFEIFFNDLNTEAQHALLNLVGAESPKDMNWDLDIVPLATIEFEDEE